MVASTRDQIIVSVAVALMISLMLTFGGYMAGQQTRESAKTLATDGVVVDGRVANKVQRFGGVLNGPKYTWWFDLTYTTRDGHVFAKTVGVDESIYDRVPIGPIPVTYIRTKPSEFFIAGVYDSVNHSNADIGVVESLSFCAGIASVLLGVVLAFLLIARNGGGSPAPRHDPEPPSGQYRGIRRKQPGQFGKGA